MMKLCVICGEQFQAKDPQTLTCSLTCYRNRARDRVRDRNLARSARRETIRMASMRSCAACGVIFIRKKDASSRTITCSRICSIKHNRTRIREYGIRNRESLRRACTICGAVFIPKKTAHFTCSEACRITYKVEYSRKRFARIQSIRETSKTMRTCVVCNATFAPRNSRNICCSKACHVEHQKVLAREYRDKNRAVLNERNRKYCRERGYEGKQRSWRKWYAEKGIVIYSKKYRMQFLAYKTLKTLGVVPDHLSTWSQRLRFSRDIMNSLLRTSPASNQKEKDQ